MTLRESLLVLRKRFWLIVAGALIAGAVAAMLSLLWPPTYQAEAVLLISKLRLNVILDPRFQTIAEENIVNLSIQDDQVRRQTLVGLTRNPALLLQVVDRLGDTLPAEERTVDYLQNVLDVRTEGNLIIFEVQANTPTKAAEIVNAWAEVYQEHVNRLYGTTSPTYEEIKARVDSALAGYQAAEEAVEAFIRQSTEAETARQIEQKKQMLTDLQAGQLAAARQRVDSLHGRITHLERLTLGAQGLQARLAGVPASTPLTAGEQYALFLLEATAFTYGVPLSATLEIGAEWPLEGVTAGQAIERLSRLVMTLEDMQASAEEAIANQSLALLNTPDLLAQDQGMADSIARLQADIAALEARLQQQQAEKQDLLEARNIARDSYLTLVRKAEEVHILSSLTGTEVQVAAHALPPGSPARASLLILTALGVLAGALAGLGLAFGKYW